MNLRQLRYFCEVVDAGHARAAAEKLHVAPTAISMQLAQLEDTVGGRLFDRASRPMALTPLGQFVYPKAKDILAATQRLAREAKDMAAGKVGWVAVGFTRSTIFSVLPQAVRQMQAALPQVRIDLVEVLTEDQAASLQRGEIHIGLGRVIGKPPAGDDGLACTTLFDDPLVAALPASHALARRKRLNVKGLDALPYITYPGGANSVFSRQLLAVLEADGARPRIGHQAKELHTALGLVAAGLGFTVVGRSVAAHERPDVRFLPIAGSSACSTVFALHKRDAANPLVEAFLRHLREAASNA